MKSVLTVAILGLGFGLILKFHSGGAPIGVSMLVALLGVPIVGVLATIDDDLPGGWSNPDGSNRPSWLTWQFWAQLASMSCISGIGFAIDLGITRLQAVPWILLAAVGVAGCLFMARRAARVRSA
jgi:hypothetical protein